MCGVCGIVDAAGRRAPDRAELEAMNRALAHRGPDDSGLYLEGPVGLAMRRLSIIDLEAGHQPLVSDDRALVVVFNGEIYNFIELRAGLEAAGYRFRTRSDTEVLLHGYRAWGAEGLLARLNGMFAFAVWDARRRRLLLARDRLGIKPLYYVHVGGRLAFASELRALLTLPWVPREPDPAAVGAFLTYQFVPGVSTVLAGVRRLPAGHLAEADVDGLHVSRYWTAPGPSPAGTADLDAVVGEVEALLDDAVRLQVRADVPIGAFLSGGLDSSLVVALMARHMGGRVRAFSIGFPGADGFDETLHAVRVAAAVGVEHQVIPLDGGRMVEEVPRALADQDEPLADPALVPTRVLAQAAREHVKVVLTGEGADELFAGYPYYAPLVAAVPGGVARRLLGRFRGLATGIRSSGLSGYPYVFPADDVSRLLGPAARGAFDPSIWQRLEAAAAAPAGPDPLARALRVDTAFWLADDLLMKVDRATMAHSLEARVPYLDHRLVERLSQLPSSLKLAGGRDKAILRRCFADLLPAEVRARQKHGFNLPIDQWLRGPLRGWLEETLLDGPFQRAGLLEPSAVRAVVDAHLVGRRNAGRRLWTLAALEAWGRATRVPV